MAIYVQRYTIYHNYVLHESPLNSLVSSRMLIKKNSRTRNYTNFSTMQVEMLYFDYGKDCQKLNNSYIIIVVVNKTKG